MTIPALTSIAETAPLDLLIREGMDLPPGTPREYGHVAFVSADGCFASGVWRGEAGLIPIESYPVDEFCTLVKGEVTLTDEQGTAQTFTAGMTFVVPVGFRGTWSMPMDTIKLFAAHGTAEAVGMLIGEDKPARAPAAE